MSVTTGTRIGPYEVVAAIGAGGMGEVYRARDARLQRDVAIKILPEMFAADPERLARFEREAQALAALNHPHIAQIYGLEGQALVMELVDGETLADRLARGPIPPEETVAIARQIADGLDAAHSRGIIHRDLKPANVKLTPAGQVKILDFGLAKLSGPAEGGPYGRADLGGLGSPKLGTSEGGSRPDASPTITSPAMATGVGALLGTAAYMAPEQTKGRDVDKRADIWGFGCLVYEMATGARAFAGDDVSEVFAAVLRDTPDLTRVPVTLRRLVERCLVKDPNRRLRDVGDLELLLDERGPAPPRSRRAWWAWPAVAALFAIASLVGFARLRMEAPAATALRFDVLPADGTRLGAVVAVSPDGHRLAFAAVGENGRPTIWIRDLESGTVRTIKGTEGVGTPILWSPDGKSLAFSGAPPLAALLRIDASNGPVQTLCPAPTGPPIAAWNRDGVIVFRAADGLRRVAASGGECAPLTTVRSDRGESRHTAPTFLPDGRRFLYFRASDRPDVRGIYVGSLDLTPDRQVGTRLFASEQPVQFVAPDILLSSRDRAILAQRIDLASLMPIGDVTTIASDVPSEPGPSDTPLGMSSTSDVLAYRVRVPLNPQVRWFDVDGRQGDPVGDPAPVASLALSHDGSRVAMQRADVQGNMDVWIHDVARRTTTRVTFGGAQNGPAVWSRDDRVLFFASDRSGRLQIFRRSSDLAGAEEQVLRSTGEDTPLDVSPDGRLLLFSRAAVTSADDLWVLPLDTPSAQPIALLDSRAREIQARFSPDGRYIVYVSNESGAAEVYVRPFADGKVGAPQLVSEGGGAFPLWPTSTELFYVRPDLTMVRVPVKTTPAFERGAAQPLYRAPLSVVSMTAPSRWDATRDGKRFVMVTANDRGAAAHIAVVVNWQQLLASKTR